MARGGAIRMPAETFRFFELATPAVRQARQFLCPRWDTAFPYNYGMADREDKDGDGVDDDFARAMSAENVVPLRPERRARAHGAPPVRLPPISPHPDVTPTGGDAEEQDDEFAAHGVNRREIRKLK